VGSGGRRWERQVKNVPVATRYSRGRARLCPVILFSLISYRQVCLRLLKTTPLTWITVSRSALRHNVEAIKALLATRTPSPRLIAVVKANAYGHDAVQATRVMAEAGVDFFAVTTAAEAIELRAAGIDAGARILVFAPPIPDEAEALIEQDVDATVADAIGIEMGVVSNAAARVGKTATILLKVDTGMGRLGALPRDAVVTATHIASGPQTTLGGVYTHFGRALDRDFGPTRKQLARFESVLADIRAAGVDPGLRHSANSAAMLRDPATWLDAVRVGTLLYGQYPASHLPRTLDLRDTWQFHTHIISVRDVPAGTAVGYGAEFVTHRTSRLAVLPVGYADGFTLVPTSLFAGQRGILRVLKGKAGSQNMVTVRGKQAPVVGRVAMQMCTVDVTDITGVETGDIVDVPVRRLSASARLPRIYED
jgi:alanine racemase